MTALGLGLGSALNPLGIGPSISTTFVPRTYAAIAETLALQPVEIVGQPSTATDTLGLSTRCTVIYRQIAEATEALGLTPVLSSLPGVVLVEMLGLASAVTPNQIAQLTVTEALQLVEQLLAGVPVSVSETLGLAIVESVQQVTEVIEALGLAPAIVGAAIYNKSVSDTIGFADSLANFFGAEVTESLNLQPLMAGNLLIRDSVEEVLGLSDTQVANLVLRVTAEETLLLEDVEILNGLYQGTITEELGLTAAYISPGGGFVTWAMNTRTGAITEYSDYVFNSFARLGNQYIGASSDGLYELVGDDDDGADIIAQIKSGFAQWAGSKFTLIKGVYLGMRGGGEFVLKLTTGDGRSYHYGVSARDMRTTKVRMGKGLRARYFNFELISAGQDFDFDSIEFVPLVADRRV